MRSSITLLEEYLQQHGIAICITDYIKTINSNNQSNEKIDKNFFDNIIVDGYDGFSDSVKNISNYLIANYKVYLGRKEKTIIKKILDYEWYELIKSLKIEIDERKLKDLISEERKSNANNILVCRENYFKNLTHAINEKNDNRVADYINFLYSKILIYNEYKKRSVADLFLENEYILKKDLPSETYIKFQKKCLSISDKLPYDQSVELFNNLYHKEVLNNGNENSEVVAIKLNQTLFDQFKSKDEFLSYVFELFKVSYEVIQNHRTFIVKIDNIISSGKNIKWELYSFLTVYGENFIFYDENRQYFKPEDICIDFLEHKYNLIPNDDICLKFKHYFKGEIDYASLISEIENEIPKSEIDFFKRVYNGFHFIDCLILKSTTLFENSKELDFIKNNNELLLIFSKHKIDDRKIPCPVCGSLKISGNSYPAVGIKSWECKNDLCSERSKTNRGKRYSSRSNDMQNGVSEECPENIISKELISKWRKDIILEKSVDTLYEMIIKYFSYKDGYVSFFNFSESEYKIPKEVLKSRRVKFSNIEELLSVNKFRKNTFKEFIQNDLISKFIYNTDTDSKTKLYSFNKVEKYEIFNENCLTFLRSVSESSIDHMVTSPPYYNAREYSQWKNLYNYLNDMYKICLASFNALKPGGVFFYNIGDIFDNPNTVVKSKMGEKRVALGAYIILVFKSAGFEILDNIIWDKGETQSNRHKNDGNFTPYYQRPANCYEHMFIFKKPGKLKVSANPILKDNIQRFSPVIKINSKGENTFGHTAPYPPELPLISIKTFTNEGDIVFDPFLGSGTSVYIAVLNGRKGIGTELDKVYYKLANSNINSKINQSFQIELF